MSELKLCKDCIDEPFCGFPHTGNSLGCDYWIKEDVDAQAVDAVPVVRCRECKNWKPSGSKAGNSISDMEYIGGCEFSKYLRRESDFCSYGERKEGADND